MQLKERVAKAQSSTPESVQLMMVKDELLQLAKPKKYQENGYFISFQPPTSNASFTELYIAKDGTDRVPVLEFKKNREARLAYRLSVRLAKMLRTPQEIRDIITAQFADHLITSSI
jgi:hypothetical protein